MIFRMTSLKQQIEYFHFRCKIQLEVTVFVFSHHFPLEPLRYFIGVRVIIRLGIPGGAGLGRTDAEKEAVKDAVARASSVSNFTAKIPACPIDWLLQATGSKSDAYLREVTLIQIAIGIGHAFVDWLSSHTRMYLRFCNARQRDILIDFTHAST